MDFQLNRELHVTTITLAEIRFGIELLPHGRRRSDLALRFEEMIEARLSSQVLAFDEAASISYAIVAAHRQRTGRRSDVPDMQIAAICRANAASLATRNIKDFEHTGVPLTNPWESLNG